MFRYLIFILSAGMMYSCNNITGSGDIQTEKRNISKFSGVQTSGSIDVEVSNGEIVSVEVEADNNVLPYIVTESRDGLLDVYYKPGSSFTNSRAKVYVTAPVIDKIFVKGSGNITSKNMIKSREVLRTGISGSGDIDANIDALSVEAQISGSGNIRLQGRCKNFDAGISGSGDLKCHDLLSENAQVKIAGSGSAHVYASVHLVASVMGSGDIYYRGNPTSPEISKTGSGSINAEK